MYIIYVLNKSPIIFCFPLEGYKSHPLKSDPYIFLFQNEQNVPKRIYISKTKNRKIFFPQVSEHYAAFGAKLFFFTFLVFYFDQNTQKNPTILSTESAISQKLKIVKTLRIFLDQKPNMATFEGMPLLRACHF